MLLTSLMCLLLAQAPVEAESVAQLTGVVGSVRLGREGNEQLAVAKTGLLVQDTIATGDESGAIVYWRSGITLYMGAGTRVEVGPQTPVPTLILSSGEIRITAGNPGGVKLVTPLAEARLARGIMRAAVSSKGERFYSEAGNIAAQARELEARRSRSRSRIMTVGFQDQAADRPVIQLKSGEEITVLPGQGIQKPQRGDSGEWKLDVEKLKRAAAADASRAYRDAVAQENINRANTTDPLPADAPDGAAGNQDSTNTSTQINSSTGVNLSLGNVLASNAAGTAGGLFTDANQNTLAGKLTVPYQNLPAGSTFAGNIHLLTGQTTYTMKDVNLALSDNYPGGLGGTTPQYWSIGLGSAPTGQITTGIGTGTSANPNSIPIRGFDAYVVQLDQFGIPDPANPNPPPGQFYAVPGLVGEVPVNPNIQGATPLQDQNAQFNPNATFALGQIALGKTADNNPQLLLRRSDQDRKIIKDLGGNDNLDQVTANPDVTGFQDVPDPVFFPSLPTVKVPDRGPNALRNLPQYRNQAALERAAITTVTAEGLSGYARRTGQTRFVVDGKIIDISGYKPKNP